MGVSPEWGPEQARRAVMNLAIQVVHGAYEEAMRKRGVMPGVRKLVHADAEKNLEALEQTETSPEASDPES
ncbi:hypothetical protein ABZ801_00925 [Actinomadura sp. NPDC047616]|uniref:hypothetical protein n=1 Tax=Actinomadura sp. NPDC047616 TaxID=3155914 RepID=UPI0033C67357